MIITIHCGGMPFNGDTIKTGSIGGSETAAYYVAKELAARGHRVTMFTSLNATEGTFDGVKYIWHGPVSERAPLGELFHFYASNTPHDVCIIQRQPGAFVNKWASKINISWLHDLAFYRQRALVNSAAWNIDAVFTVSEWHRKQVMEVYGLSGDVVKAVKNGVDLSLYHGETSPFPVDTTDKIKLLYCSRPERGLEHLVSPGGIMDRLYDIDPRFHLYVCNYNHVVPQMKDYYDALYERIAEMRNVTDIGHLTKQELADVQRQCDALVYPTEFEDTSCIVAMEAKAAGLPFISSETAALPETCKQYGNFGGMLFPLKDGKADEDAFVEYLSTFTADNRREAFRKEQERDAVNYSWTKAVDMFEQHISDMFAERNRNPETVLKHLIHNSDYYAACVFNEKQDKLRGATIGSQTRKEMDECYAFARDNKWKEHYEAYYEYERARGVKYGPEDVTHNNRYRTVAGKLSHLPAGGIVLDYGCAHGHYTVNLAKQYPHLEFIGIDLAQSNIDIARKWADDDKVPNVRFYCGSAGTGSVVHGGSEESQLALKSLDAIIAAEVLEHVAEPWALADTLSKYLKDDGLFIGTTPVGPWEAVGYKDHWPWRAHVHHLERDDLHDLFGKHPSFTVNVCASGTDKAGDTLGSYVWSFKKPKEESGRIDYERKFSLLNPRQTLAVCVIARDAELTLGKCLDSVKDIADEIIVAVDEKTKDGTREIARKYAKSLNGIIDPVFDIPSPTETGFDEARNASIAKAEADWILWIDSDEVLHKPHHILKYLRQNQYQAYALKQIHYSVEPAGVLKTDLPSRLFRNKSGIKFYGVVHEHPETELNKGIGHITVIEEVAIAHHGYHTEDVRRGRFDRNIGLLVKDREKYPDRILGKLLWLRDLAQMCGWELEQNGGQVTNIMQERARIGLQMWEELLELGQLRMITDPDNLRFYSTLCQILQIGFDFGFKMDVSKLNGGVHPDKAPALVGRFASREHAEKLFLKLLSERTMNYDSKYY